MRDVKKRWYSPPDVAAMNRGDRTLAAWVAVAAVVWGGLCAIWFLLEWCFTRFYDPMLGGPGVRGWAMVVNGMFAGWLVVVLVPLVWRRRRADTVRRIALVASLALLGALHLMLVTFGVFERAFPRDEIPRRVQIYVGDRARWMIEVDRMEFDPIEHRLRDDIRAAGSHVAPTDGWPGVLAAAKAVPPPLRFRTFTVRVDDGRLRIAGNDFGPAAPEQRILIRHRIVFVDGEHRGSFRE